MRFVIFSVLTKIRNIVVIFIIKTVALEGFFPNSRRVSEELKLSPIKQNKIIKKKTNNPM